MLAWGFRVRGFQPRAVSGPDPGDGYARAAGVLHVHTSHSDDAAGSPESVVAAARAAGLDFLAITDHNSMDARAVEGVHGRTLVLVGVEASTVSGHVVGLGLREPAFRFSRDPRDTLDDIRDLGGIAFIAHPASPRRDLAWQTWDQPGPWGMEVLSADSQFRQAGWPARARTALAYPLNARYALLSHMTRPAAALRRWDSLLGQRPVPGVAGSDAHGQVELPGRLSVGAPSHAALFAVARTHVLLERAFTGRLDADRAVLLRALAAGRSYVGLDALAPAGGFAFLAEAGGRRWTMGETVHPQTSLRLRAGGRVPAGTRLILLKDGEPIAKATEALDVPVKATGVYRVEAYVPGWRAPWIITNPIAVLDPAAAAARAERARWPLPPAPVPSPAAILEAFDAEDGFFQPGADDRSRVSPPLWDPAGGVQGGAARFAFALGAPDKDHPHVFSALVNRRDRDLSGRQGLVLSVRADGVYRMWVQVRDANPASPDEGTEWWFASVRTSPEWRRVALPFARLRSIQKNSDGRLDPDKVKALVLVIDAGAMKPGTKGTIWIDDLGVY